MTGGEPPEVLERTQGRGWRLETWRFAGSRGDPVLAEAWLADEPGPVVVAGHGAEADRRVPYPAATGRGWARRGISIVCADAPGHGDRAGSGPGPSSAPPPEGGGWLVADPGYLRWWLGDHRLLIGAVAARFGAVPLGYLGVSMGGVFGVHLMAGEPRISGAVFAVAGCTTARCGEANDPCDAARSLGGRPVLMVQADSDELVPRAAAFSLYDALGTTRKEICFLPGTHADWLHPARWNRRMLSFFAETLR